MKKRGGFWCVKTLRQFCLATSAGCFSLVSGMALAEQNGGDFIGYGTFVFIDNSNK